MTFRVYAVGFWCHRASLALPPGKPPAAGVRFPSPSVIILYHTLDYLSTGKMHKFGIFIVLFFVAFAN